MKFKDTTITPRYAQQLLARNEGNRAIRSNMVNRYAAMMLAGRWLENGDVIRVGKTGRLLDGQHRLLAVVESGIPIRCGLVLDVDEATFSTIDTGGSRTARDIVAMSGRANAGIATPTAAQLWRIIHGVQKNTAVPPTYLVEILNRWPEIDHAASRSAGSETARGLLTPAVLSMAYLYLHAVANKPELAERFVTGMNAGEGLVSGDPILALRQRMINLRQGSVRSAARTVWGAVVRTIDALETGEPLQRIKIDTESGIATQPALFSAHMQGETKWRALADLIPYATGQTAARFKKLAAE